MTNIRRTPAPALSSPPQSLRPLCVGALALLSACGLAGAGQETGDLGYGPPSGRTEIEDITMSTTNSNTNTNTNSNTSTSTSTSSSTNISTTNINGRTRVEISIAGHPKIVRDYDFPVNVTSQSSSEGGVQKTTIVIRNGNGKVVETIEL